MNPKIKNTIIFLVVAMILVFGAIYFMSGENEEGNLLSSVTSDASIEGDMIDSKTTSNFLALLLSVRSIRLDDSIFSQPAFTSLVDSTVTLTPDGNEGRPNPFAPIGSDVVEITPQSTTPLAIEPETVPEASLQSPTSVSGTSTSNSSLPATPAGESSKPAPSSAPVPQTSSQGAVGNNTEEDLTSLGGELESLLGELEQ